MWLLYLTCACYKLYRNRHAEFLKRQKALRESISKKDGEIVALDRQLADEAESKQKAVQQLDEERAERKKRESDKSKEILHKFADRIRSGDSSLRAMQQCGAIDFDTNDDLLRFLEDVDRYGHENPFAVYFSPVPRAAWLQLLQHLTLRGIDVDNQNAILHEALEWSLGNSPKPTSPT